MRKVFTLLLACMIAVSLAALGAAEEEPTLYTSGDFMYYLNEGGEAVVSGYTGESASVDIPGELDGYTVVEINDFGFFNQTTITSVSMSEGLRAIGSSAFDGCESLVSVSFPASFRSVGFAPFANCLSLAGFSVSPENPVVKAVDGVLVNMETQTLIAYPPGRTSAGYNVPPEILSIGDYAFYTAGSLRSINLPAGLLSIGEASFYFCTSLTSVSLPASVISIGDTAFTQCYALSDIWVAPDNTDFTDIDGVLVRKDGAELVAYPAGKTAAVYAVPPEIQSIGDSAFYCSPSLTFVEIPEGIRSIGPDAFFYCEALTSVNLPASLQSIGEDGFRGCAALTTLTLPEGLSSIGVDAFYGCSSLTLTVSPASYAQQYAEEMGIPYEVSGAATTPEARTGMVTITYPDGTVIQLAVEDLPALLPTISQPSEAVATEPPSEVVATEPPAEVPWPSYVLPKYRLEPKLLAAGERVMAYLGPSKNYLETAAYTPGKMSRADGLFKEGSFVFVDMNYPSVGVRRTYFFSNVFRSTYEVPEVTLTGYSAETTGSAQARYGPGATYDPFDEASVGPGTALTVFFEEDGYVFAEYEVNAEFVRAWLPAGSVRPK